MIRNMEIELKLFQYIMRLLKKAHYEYDPSVKAWVAWIEGFPGIYAQAKNVERVRSELISTLALSLTLVYYLKLIWKKQNS